MFQTLVSDWPVLSESLGVTLLTTLEGFIAAAVGGIALALLFNQSKWLEYSLFPYAVILQVTPVIAIAPLLLIYLPQQTAVHRLRLDRRFLSGPVQHHARAEFGGPQSGRAVSALWRVAAAEALRYLKLPAALPAILGGLRIAGGLSLIGAVVAEIAAGAAGAGSGLAFRIAESGYRLNIPRMFAALLLLSVAGIVIYGLLALVSHLVLRRWHERAWKGKLMAAANISSEKIDLLVYGPDQADPGKRLLGSVRPAHGGEPRRPRALDARRAGEDPRHGGHLSHGAGRQESAVAFPKLEIVASFGVGYDHVDSAYAREHNIVVTNTPDVLTEEVADVAMGAC